MPSDLSGVLLVIAIFLGFGAMILLISRDRGRLPGWQREEVELRAYAVAHGWQVLDRPAGVPPAVAHAARAPSSRLLMVRPGGGRPVWLSWHIWQEANPSADGGWIVGTRVLTRYFLLLPAPCSAMSVRPRTKVGGLLRARRGPGTGHEEFDRAFLIEASAGTQPALRLTAAMRRALLAGTVPPWSIADDILMTAYSDPPTPENLEPRAVAIRRVATLLTA